MTGGHKNHGYSGPDADTESFSQCFKSTEVLTHKNKDNAVELTDFKKATEHADYDPYKFRDVQHPTTNAETLLHLLKGSLGTGILAMPLAFYHSGWLLGVIATTIIGSLCTYCIHLLIRAEYELCKRDQIPSMTYPATAEAALKQGPMWLRKVSPYIQHVINTFLLTYQLGTCCVYTVFIADNIKQVGDEYIGELDARLYMLIFLLPLILINYLKNLKLLAPLSTIANIITIASFGIILYYLIESDISLEGKDAFGDFNNYPLFFGTVLFALEAIGVIMPLENEMKTPKSFGGPFGVLNIGMISIIFLYVGMGLLGFLAYGSGTKGSITLNIGDENRGVYNIPAQVAKVMLSIAIYISHSLQMYVAIDITWNEYLQRKFEKRNHQIFWEYFVRTCLVLVTFCLAVAVPELDLFISLFGALCLSALGLAFPALIDTCTYWDSLEGTRGKLIIAKNMALMAFAIFGLCIGTYTSLQKIVERFSS